MLMKLTLDVLSFFFCFVLCKIYLANSIQQLDILQGLVDNDLLREDCPKFFSLHLQPQHSHAFFITLKKDVLLFCSFFKTQFVLIPNPFQGFE